jgi:hypothetical protein
MNRSAAVSRREHFISAGFKVVYWWGVSGILAWKWAWIGGFVKKSILTLMALP